MDRWNLSAPPGRYPGVVPLNPDRELAWLNPEQEQELFRLELAKGP